MASGINYCIFEDCLVEKGNEEETRHSTVMIKTKRLFQIMYFQVIKVWNSPPPLAPLP